MKKLSSNRRIEKSGNHNHTSSSIVAGVGANQFTSATKNAMQLTDSSIVDSHTILNNTISP